MSIIPGIENLAPERTETRSGAGPPPKVRPLSFSRRATASSTSCQSPSGGLPSFMTCRQASVVIVKPGRHPQTEPGHLRQSGAFAPEQVAHRGVSLGEIQYVAHRQQS